MTNEEIYQRGVLINDETEPAQNTSTRVGGVIKGIGENLTEKDAAIAAQAARNGYYQCTVSGTTLAVNAPGFTLPAHGGNIRIKMSAPATGASTLNINGTGPKTLLYNGAALSSANTWEQKEIISVFYDPSGSGQYLASNSQGGGGKAEKIKFDNSQSGLASQNVQEAIDELKNDIDETASTLFSPIESISPDGSVGATNQIDTSGTIVGGQSNAWNVQYIQVGKGDRIYFTLSYTSSKDARFGLFTTVPALGSTALAGSYERKQGKNISYNYTAQADGYFAYSYYTGSGTQTLRIERCIVSKINIVEQDVNTLKASDFYEINLSQLALYNGALDSSSYKINDWGSHYVIAVNGAKQMKITPKSGGSAYVFFLKSYTPPPSDGYVPDFCTGYSSRQAYATEQVVAIPSDCNYIAVYAWYNSTTNNSPSHVYLSTFNSQIYNRANVIEEKVDGDGYGISFAQGSWGSTGKPLYNVGYVRSNLFKGARTIQVASGYTIHYLFKWNSVNSFVNYAVEDVSILNIPSDAYYYSIVVKKSGGGNISPNEEILKVGVTETVFDSVIGDNLSRLASATLNVIGDSISNPARSEYENSKIWWRIAADALGMTVGTYSTISGTPVAGTANDSFHKRVKNLTLDGTVTIIAGGMNDLGSDNRPLGTFDYSSSLDSQIAADSTLTNKFIPAYRETIEWILTHNKNTRLYLCTITPRAIKKSGMSDAQYLFPWTNPTTGGNWAEFNEAIRKLAHDYGLGLIDWRNIGMYQQNGFKDESGTLPADNIWTSDGVHPNVTYQKKMGDFATHVLMETMF